MNRLVFACGLVAALASMLLLSGAAFALPRMTLTSGAKCENCHVNPQGSGLRNAMGFYSADELHMVGWDKLGLASLQSLASNQVAGDKVTIGADLRFQMAKFGRPVRNTDGSITDPDRLFIPMQLQLGAAWDITPKLSATASVNGAAFKYRYMGQTYADGWLRYVPESTWVPSVRAGLIQPSLGIRHDDHTMLLRSNPFSPGQPLIPPMWADPGAELSWAPVHGLQIEAAGLYSRWMTEANAQVKEGSPIATARATWSPQIEALGVNTWLGASMLQTSGLSLQGAHLGVGKGYLGSLQAEMTHTTDKAENETLAFLVHAAWTLKEWLVIEGRYEQAHGTAKDGTKAQTTSAVAGIQWFPLRFVEIRPEYRFFQTKDYAMGQWSAQLHLWF